MTYVPENGEVPDSVIQSWMADPACPACCGTGYVIDIVPTCCRFYLRTGECCGNPEPDPTPNPCGCLEPRS